MWAGRPNRSPVATGARVATLVQVSLDTLQRRTVDLIKDHKEPAEQKQYRWQYVEHQADAGNGGWCLDLVRDKAERGEDEAGEGSAYSRAELQ
jgi:hypothetical protein